MPSGRLELIKLCGCVSGSSCSRPGDVVTAEFRGAQGVKRRPAVVVSSAAYHAVRPDVMLSLLTTRTAQATGPTDYRLRDWQVAGLFAPSAFRSFLGMALPAQVTVIGHLSAHDWREVQQRLGMALETIPPAQLQAEQAAAREQQRADKLAAKLRALGLDPERI